MAEKMMIVPNWYKAHSTGEFSIQETKTGGLGGWMHFNVIVGDEIARDMRTFVNLVKKDGSVCTKNIDNLIAIYGAIGFTGDPWQLMDMGQAMQGVEVDVKIVDEEYRDKVESKLVIFKPAMHADIPEDAKDAWRKKIAQAMGIKVAAPAPVKERDDNLPF